jgi:hypothetical protein
MARHDISQNPAPHPENLPHLGFDLFPPADSAAPATHAAIAAPPAAALPRHAPYSSRPSFWRLHAHWLRPLAFFVLALTIFDLKLAWDGGYLLALFAQPVLGLFLLYRAVIGLVVCFLAMKLMDDDVGPIFPFLVQILGATAFTGALGFVIPTVGIWVVEPLVLCWLFTWFLELSVPRGTFYALITWGIIYGLIFYVIARTLEPLLLRGN